MTPERMNKAFNAINGNHHDMDEKIAYAGRKSISFLEMSSLRPGKWLDDVVIDSFFKILADLNYQMCPNGSSRTSLYIYGSYFITQLLSLGKYNFEPRYNHDVVKTYSKHVPSKDIFLLEKLIFPIHLPTTEKEKTRNHWILGAIYFKEQQIVFFDSCREDWYESILYDSILNYIDDEYKKKRDGSFNRIPWSCVHLGQNTPRQDNGMFNHRGLYVMFLYYFCFNFFILILTISLY